MEPRLVLKATAPRAAKNLLTRDRLGLGEAALRDCAVVALHASAGFGKTALLTQWRRQAITAGACVAWLSIDPQDDPSRFVEGLVLATRIATGRLSREWQYEVGVERADPAQSVARCLMDLAGYAGEVLLVLDDVHTLPGSSHAVLAYLLHHLPANVRVVLASRRALPLVETELLSKGRLATLHTDALRLTLAETGALLRNRFGVQIDADLCARLHQLTEGWALGLQLVVSTTARQSSLQEAVAACHEHSGDMHHFFVATLERGLDPADLDFLTAVSFLDALHPDLCQAVTGNHASAQTLARLCAQTPILTEAVDSVWLRIHSLAKDFLCERFEALPEPRRRQLCAAACTWLAEHRFHEEAARHALRSGQEALAFDLAEQSLYAVFITGQISRIMQWVDRLPPAQLEQRPRLRIALGWALAQSARGGQAAGVVAPILEDLGADIVSRFESIQIVSAAAYYADRPQQVEQLFAPWRQNIVGFNAVQRQVTANLDAMLLLHRGAPEQARFVLSQAVEPLSEAGRYATGVRDWITAMSYFWQGQVLAADTALASSLAKLEQATGRRSPIASTTAATLATVRWERDALADIDAMLADRRDVIDQHGMPCALVMSYVTTARMAVHKGDMQVGYDVLERLLAIGQSRDMPRLCVAALAEQMRMCALDGHPRTCESIAQRLTPLTAWAAGTGDALVRRLSCLQLDIADAYYQISRHHWALARVSLARARPVAETLRRSIDLLRIHLLDALAAKQLGEDAGSRFREGVRLLDTLGLKRQLADTHPLLLAWKESLSGPPGRAHTAAIPTATAHVPSTLLTKKEREVLVLLANNLSNKEMASALDVSVDAIKWHMKNLFGKCNAGSRKHLLEQARHLGLIA